MTDELFSLQAMLVSPALEDQHLFRRAVSASKVPIELIEANGAASASRPIAGGVDVVFLDAALGDETVARLTSAARRTAKPPFTVLLSHPRAAAGPFHADALAAKPSNLEEAKWLVDRAIRVRLPSRVLVLDDSPTMRAIVRKILEATRLPLELTEAQQGAEALELSRQIDFDMVFLDYNLPGLSGLETMAEIRREKRNPTFVLITSDQDPSVADRARAKGAAFLKKPFYIADIEAVLCGFYGLRAFNPQRA
jgi:CheY-like chemotaxis protein